MLATDKPPKRKKSEPTAVPMMRNQTPHEVVEARIDRLLASLPKPIGLIGKTVFTKHMKLCNEIDKIRNRLHSLGPDSGKLPLSLRFKFKLNSTDKIKETQEFKRLSAECDEHLDYCQGLIKANISDVVKLELASHKNKMKEHFCESMNLLATAFVKNHPSIPDTQNSVTTLVLCALDSDMNLLRPEKTEPNTIDEEDEEEDEPFDSELLMYSGFNYKITNDYCYNEFYTLYHEYNNLDGEAPMTGTLTQTDFDLVEPIDDTFWNLVRRIFYISRKALKECVAQRKAENELSAWAESALNAKKTAAVAATIADVNLTSPEIGDLIESKVQERTKEMQKELDRIQKQLKNNSGARTGARQKSSAEKQRKQQKQKQKQKEKKEKEKKSNAQQAADADNDSTAATKNNVDRRRRRQPNGKKTVRHF